MGRSPRPPLASLEALPESARIADGPAIRFGFGWLKLRLPTRMTLLRLAAP